MTDCIGRGRAARLRVGEHPRDVILPLQDEEIDDTVKAAAKPTQGGAAVAVQVGKDGAMAPLPFRPVSILLAFSILL